LAGSLPLKVSVTEQSTGSAAADFKEWGVNNVQNKNIQSNSFGSCAGSAAAFSQEAGRSDAAAHAFGAFVKTTTDNGVKQGATNSGGVLASYRFFFSDSHGVELNYGYSLNTQTYGSAAGPMGAKPNQNEVTAAYVYQHAMRRFTPFVEAGVGDLVFAPADAQEASTEAC
jgi:hypothetical protein